jgi:heavy metal efflux system protein
MIGNLISFCLKNRPLVMGLMVVLLLGGSIAYWQLPIAAYPDIADTYVQVISQWPGHAAEEIEQQLTVPLEIALNATPHHTHLRSISLPGLSVITMIFDENTNSFMARQMVLEKLQQATLPPNVQPTMQPDSSPVGQIYWYVLDSKTRSPMELKEIEDWELEKRWKEVPGIADVSSFGGMVKQYQAILSPTALGNYGLSTSNVVQAIAANNQNSGGGFLFRGLQSYNIRGVGKASTSQDLEKIVVAAKNGTPIRVGNLGHVVIGEQPRLGAISLSERLPDGSIDDRDEVVEGIVLSRTGEIDQQVLERIHKKKEEIEKNYLPSDIKIKPYLDRSELIELTSHTVQENMITGMCLVCIILLFFLGNLRSALIVALTIPLSLLFASILLDLRHIPANLLSLGALDFGMIVDGSVVMVENIFRHRRERQKDGKPFTMYELILQAAREVERPIVYAIAIIILAYLPVFTLQRIEGRLFSPLAWTIAFALLGSLLISLTIVPVLCSFLLKGEQREWHNPFLAFVQKHYRGALEWALDHKLSVVGVAVVSFLGSLYLALGGPIGSEFLPHLDEGAIWLRGTLPPSTSHTTAKEFIKQARAIIMKFPEVPMTVCQIGRPDDGTDSTGFFNSECYVGLKPRKEWRREYVTKEDLIAGMSQELSKIPGVIWNFSQPISDNVEEAMSGVKGALVVKVYGDDLTTLSEKAHEIKKVMGKVKGIEDLGVFDVLGQPNVDIQVDRDTISRYGLNISDVQDVIETAVGGKVASQKIEGEKRFDIVVRYEPQFREQIDQIRRITVTTPDGYRIPLDELATFSISDGASMIYRENNNRFIAVKFSVRGRDLASSIAEAQSEVKKQVQLPPHYRLDWTGEFESEQRAEARLAIVIPITIFSIFFLLYLMFHSAAWATIHMACVLTARIGGVLALYLTGTNFSVSSGIGFLAVFGVSIQTGVILVSYVDELRKKGVPLREAIVEGCLVRVRPILMTALVATFGLLPAALSHGIGSDSQRPMAIVIVGGLITDLIFSFFLLPALYHWFAKREKVPHGSDPVSEGKNVQAA